MEAAPLERHGFGASLLRWTGSPRKHSGFQASSLPLPQAVSSPPAVARSPGLLSKPVSQAPAPVCMGEHTPRLGHTDGGSRTACARLPWSSCVDGRLLRSRPIAPEGPLPSPLTLLTVDGTSQAREHPLTFSSRPRAHVPSCCFSSFLLLSSYPVRQGSFLS